MVPTGDPSGAFGVSWCLHRARVVCKVGGKWGCCVGAGVGPVLAGCTVVYGAERENKFQARARRLDVFEMLILLEPANAGMKGNVWVPNMGLL